MAEIDAAMLTEGDTIVTDYSGTRTVDRVDHFTRETAAGRPGVQVTFRPLVTGGQSLVQLYGATDPIRVVSTHVEREEDNILQAGLFERCVFG